MALHYPALSSEAFTKLTNIVSKELVSYIKQYPAYSPNGNSLWIRDIFS